MKNKLQQGDYVTDLTENQFNELTVFGGSKFLTYEANVKNKKVNIRKSLMSNLKNN